MLRAAALSLPLCAIFGLGSCADERPRTLGSVELKQCLAKGGFESRTPFGFPICQSRYADGGKACAGKADCLGQCLSDAPENAVGFAVGTPVSGQCQAETAAFGCFARVEGGKLVDAYACVE
jgi:hypothetical protein